MSAMMTRKIPKSAPFADDEIDLLNRVVAPSTPLQRAWLAGFLAGLDASAEEAEAAQPASPARPAEPINIVYASESGNSEKLAGELAKAARKRGLKPSVIDMADLDVSTLGKVKRLVFIAATWGEGDPPARAVQSYADLMSDKAPKLDGVEFAVLALGDSAYAQFCEVGKKIDERLAALGGKRVVDRVDCDLDFAAPAAEFSERTLEKLAPPADTGGRVIAVDFSNKLASAADTSVIEAEISEHLNLNSSQSDKQTFHIELSFTEGAPNYQPGDALDIYAENDPEYVDRLLKAAGLAADTALRQQLLTERDITTLSLKTLQDYVTLTGHQYAKAVLDQGEAPAWIAGRQLIDLIEYFPISLDAEKLLKLTRALPPRAYSIASSRADAADEAHILVSPVRYKSHGQARKGVASNYLTERLKKGAKVRVKLRANKHFRLPAADKDIIMVGPGTGIAPFRAFVQERRATEATGQSWLFFGDRRYTHDFLYQLEWQDALKDGALSRLDLAFSRDTQQKIYVQDRIWEQRRDLVNWLDSGAFFYVCGDAKAMAKDVRNALIRSVADVKAISDTAAADYVAKLERERRYLQDVY